MSFISSTCSQTLKFPETNEIKPTWVSFCSNLSKVTNKYNKFKEQRIKRLKPQGRPSIRLVSAISVHKI